MFQKLIKVLNGDSVFINLTIIFDIWKYGLVQVWVRIHNFKPIHFSLHSEFKKKYCKIKQTVYKYRYFMFLVSRDDKVSLTKLSCNYYYKLALLNISYYFK